MKKRLLIVLFCIINVLNVKSQQIGMDFPKFAGKSYDFVIFQGSEQNTVFQGVIPQDGKFTLSIPKQYIPYTGMSRWLITGTKEGGGLDMFIPGHDFSVSCLDAWPNEKNIIYANNTGNIELNRLYKQQGGILSRYQSMLMAIKSYDVSNVHYYIFKLEKEKQKKDYMFFQEGLRQKKDYISRFLLMVNISGGMGSILTDREDERGKDISQYISQNLDWSSLYTSGYWSEVIEFWITIHTNILKDPIVFMKEFKAISNRILSAKLYTDLSDKVSYYLSQFGKDDYIEMIAPIVISSGKIIHYEGALSSYIKVRT